METHNTNAKTRNICLDLFKYVLAFLVVLIHFNKKSTLIPLCRLAVPTFFMISGFFVYCDDKTTEEGRNKKFIKSSLKYLLIGFLFYIIYDFINCFRYGNNLGSFFKGLFYEDFVNKFILRNIPITSGSHLWFMIALFVISIVHYFCCKFNLTKYYPIISPILIIISLCFRGYFHFFFNYSIASNYTRNAIFMGFPIFAIGYMLGKYKNKDFKVWQTIIFGVLAVGIWALSVVEKNIMILEFYICSVVASIFFILFFTSLKTPENKFTNWYYKWIGKTPTFYIYIFHMALGKEIQRVSTFSPFVNTIFIFLACFAMYEFFHLLSMLIKFIIKKIKAKRQSKIQADNQPTLEN